MARSSSQAWYQEANKTRTCSTSILVKRSSTETSNAYKHISKNWTRNSTSTQHHSRTPKQTNAKVLENWTSVRMRLLNCSSRWSWPRARTRRFSQERKTSKISRMRSSRLWSKSTNGLTSRKKRWTICLRIWKRLRTNALETFASKLASKT